MILSYEKLEEACSLLRRDLDAALAEIELLRAVDEAATCLINRLPECRACGGVAHGVFNGDPYCDHCGPEARRYPYAQYLRGWISGSTALAAHMMAVLKQQDDQAVALKACEDS